MNSSLLQLMLRYALASPIVLFASIPHAEPIKDAKTIQKQVTAPATINENNAENRPQHQRWTQLLQQHVVIINGGAITQVDYAGFQQDRAQLKAYLDQLSLMTPAAFKQQHQDDQLAFLINAYNAWTIELILNHYPTLESIRDLGSLFRSPWKKAFIPLLGDTVSLDVIEHQWIRAPDRYQEPRIHFAVNCASIGCPALRNEAYEGYKLDEQLNAQTRLFLSDRQRNRMTEGTLQLSKIFDWYRKDFERGWKNYTALSAFLADYAESLGLSQEDKSRLLNGRTKIEFLPYDWKLNDITR